jgi:hypothetical protein
MRACSARASRSRRIGHGVTNGRRSVSERRRGDDAYCWPQRRKKASDLTTAAGERLGRTEAHRRIELTPFGGDCLVGVVLYYVVCVGADIDLHQRWCSISGLSAFPSTDTTLWRTPIFLAKVRLFQPRF